MATHPAPFGSLLPRCAAPRTKPLIDNIPRHAPPSFARDKVPARLLDKVCDLLSALPTVLLVLLVDWVDWKLGDPPRSISAVNLTVNRDLQQQIDKDRACPATSRTCSMPRRRANSE